MIAAYIGYKEPTVSNNLQDASGEQEAAMTEFMANVPQYKFTPPAVTIHGNGSEP
jgi:hypothetical protein